MHKTACSYRGMVVTPHRLASEAGLDILRQGGNAVEAAVAAAAALSVVYPHMTGLGGDGFWTIFDPASERVSCIDASGISGAGAGFAQLKKAGLERVPQRGPQAMITCPGAVCGWQKALETATAWSQPLPLDCLFEAAVHYAEHGYPVSAGQAALICGKLSELQEQPGFEGQFLHNGQPPEPDSRQKLPALARTLRRLAGDGLESFYRGELARSIAAELRELGSPLTQEDLQAQQALTPEPLEIKVSGARLFNCPPPSQGVSSLMLLGIYDAYANPGAKATPEEPLADSRELIHGLVESTKLAFGPRDAHLADPARMRENARDWLDGGLLRKLARQINPGRAASWGSAAGGGDTVWLGVIDAAGRAVSCIQSIYFEFGSGVVLSGSGITWHNRGLGFNLIPGHPNCLEPRKRPFHTLNPALALFDDGRVMPYGAMGGEGQPQSQAAIFSRYVWRGWDLQEAVSAPRWLLGRTWGENSTSLKLEADFGPTLIGQLKAAGHNVETVPPRNDLMGHAGALVLHRNAKDLAKRGLIQGAVDPRSDGLAACR